MEPPHGRSLGVNEEKANLWNIPAPRVPAYLRDSHKSKKYNLCLKTAALP